MTFFQRIFGKAKSGPYFKFTKTVIHDPIQAVDGKDTIKVAKVVEVLSENNKNALDRICDILQESIEKHYDYFMQSDYVTQRLRDDKFLLFKSYFELTCLNWVILSNHFKEHRVKNEIGHALWWTIRYSFSAHDHLFSKSSFDSFENAFISRQELYARLLRMYFKPHQFQVYQNLFDIIIDRPLTDQGDEIDMIMSTSNLFQNKEKLLNSAVFNKYLSKRINDFHKKIEKIHFF